MEESRAKPLLLHLLRDQLPPQEPALLLRHAGGLWRGGLVGMNRPWQALMQLSGVLVQRCDFPRSVTVTAKIIQLLNELQPRGMAPGERLSPRQHEP